MVLHLMAGHTKGDRVVEGIIPEIAPLRYMMRTQAFRRTAILASPLISLEKCIPRY